MVKLFVKYDPRYDAECFLEHINLPEKHHYGRQLAEPEKRLRSILRPAYRAFTPTTSAEEKISAFERILSDPQCSNIAGLERIAKATVDAWNAYGHKMINALERVYDDKKFPFDFINGLITTRAGCGYFMDLASVDILASAFMSERFSVLYHELNHFMFHAHYHHLRHVLGEIKWHILKEAITVITHPAEPECYPACQTLRNFFRANRKNWQTLDQAITASLPLLE